MAKNRPRRVVIFLLFRLMSLLILIIPTRLGLIFGQYVGIFCFYLLKKERQKALDNLDIAFGDSKTVREKRRIAQKVFENLGKNFIEIISIPKFNRSNIHRYISCKNINMLRDFSKEKKGAIILSAHLGNWELLAHYLAMKGFPLNVIARRMRMQGIEVFLRRIRKKNNVNVLYRDASASQIIEVLRNKGFIGIMPDQDMDTVSGVFVDFFGRPARTPSGPSILSLVTGAFIVPCFILRKGFGHEVIIEEPMQLSISGNRERDIVENTQRYTKVIEGYIRRFPEQWVWFHDRWKTKKESRNHAEAVARFTRN